MVQDVSLGMDHIGRFRVMQSDGNLHKVGRFVGCNIVYVTFFIVYKKLTTIWIIQNACMVESLTNYNLYFYISCLYIIYLYFRFNYKFI